MKIFVIILSVVGFVTAIIADWNSIDSGGSYKKKDDSTTYYDD